MNTIEDSLRLTEAVKQIWRLVLGLAIVAVLIGGLGTGPAVAAIDDDNYEGNIFALYAGNGALVPPRVGLAESLERERPALLIYYIEDSSDCKSFVVTISQLQASYGKVSSFIPLNIDSFPSELTDDRTDPRFYYRGGLPQTVLVDGQGNVMFDEIGQARYEDIDDAFRIVFDLLPRDESVELKRRVLNEINIELVR